MLIYTGLRRGDAVRLGRQHVRDGIATIKTEKSGYTVEVSLPILPVLAKTLEAGPCGDLTFIAGENGRPLAKESFGNLFRKACNAAGLRGRSAHGLRKAAATRAANAGATVAELEAILDGRGNHGRALYPRCRSATFSEGRDAQARERQVNRCYPYLSADVPAPLKSGKNTNSYFCRGRINGLQKVRVETDLLSGKGDFCPTRTPA